MTLRDELLTGVLAAEIAPHMLDGGVAAILNILNKPRYSEAGTIDLADFAVWCGTTGLRAVVQDHAMNVVSPLRAAALTVLDFLGRTSGSIDLSQPGNQTMLTEFVAAGGITQPQVDELIAMSSRLVSRSEQLRRSGIIVTSESVVEALKG